MNTITPKERLAFAFQLKAASMSNPEMDLTNPTIIMQTDDLLKSAGFTVSHDPEDTGWRPALSRGYVIGHGLSRINDNEMWLTKASLMTQFPFCIPVEVRLVNYPDVTGHHG